MSVCLRSIAAYLVTAACAVSFLSAACNAQEDGAFTTVILVRHAEKADVGDDPPLTDMGRQRALALAHALGEVEVDVVYTTPYIRTRETAQPLAELRALPVIAIPAESYAERMATLIRSQHAGHIVVAVSHSNTVPALIEALGAGPAPVIDEDEYDDLYVVTIDAGGHATLLNLRYGPESP
ncbi:MAG: histidine phosphatase family protein [Gemmatimonadota bacterium]|nr:MAG: histidine phosphatase family protein [Gemmatimonadota bacterium]